MLHLIHFCSHYFRIFDTLPKCPGGHPILHQGLKLNSKISTRKYKKKIKSTGSNGFDIKELRKIVFKMSRDSIKHVVTVAKIQSTKGSISSSNSDGQLPNILFTYLFLCLRVLKVVVATYPKSSRGFYYFLV